MPRRQQTAAATRPWAEYLGSAPGYRLVRRNVTPLLWGVELLPAAHHEKHMSGI